MASFDVFDALLATFDTSGKLDAVRGICSRPPFFAEPIVKALSP
jgi:hypothetical protein